MSIPYTAYPKWVACLALAISPLFGAAAHAQSGAPAQTAEPAIISTLIANANFWRSQKNFAYARRELERALLAAPSNVNALSDLAEIALDAGDIKAADVYRQRLSLIAPDSVRTKALAAQHALTPEQTAMLDDARRLGRAGDAQGALLKYAPLLNDGVPPANLEVEYYTQLGGTQDGFEQAVDKLGTLAEQSPANLQLHLAFARLETLHEETRSDGLRRLTQLADAPAVSEAARQSWHDVLLWQGASEKSRSQIIAYIERFPGDTVLEAKRKEYDAVLPDVSTKAMIRGYNLMATNVQGAEQEFRTAFVANPQNPDAMSMLAAILRIWKRPAEAEVLLNRAVAIAPDRKTEFYKNAGGDFTGQIAIGNDELVQVAGLTAAGQYMEAEQLLSSLIIKHETVALLVQLADLQRRNDHLDRAAESLHKALQLAPNSGDAYCTLAELQMSRSHYDEAVASLNKAQKLYANSKNAVGLRRASMDRVDVGRAKQTLALSSPGGPDRIALAAR